MYYFLIIFSLFYVFLFVWSYVVIGNYSQLNPKDCGISRVSTLVATNCFEWHKEYGSAIKRGKFIGHSDAPWVALLGIRNAWGLTICTGSVIANKWIITAGHCLKELREKIKIYLGYNFNIHNTSQVPYYESEEVYIHPEYGYRADIQRVEYDLGLIKINQSINTSAGEHSICLPNKYTEIGVTHDYYEYVMMAGWGPNKNESRSEHKSRIVEWRLWRQFLNKTYRSDQVKLFKVNNQGLCKGDSGSPVFQYFMGRAVIAGVVSGGSHPQQVTQCEWDDTNFTINATWVDSQIDWIRNVTTNVTQLP